MTQEKIAAIIIGIISILLIVATKGIWKLTESWKYKDKTEPSTAYLVIVRCVGVVFLGLSILLLTGVIG